LQANEGRSIRLVGTSTPFPVPLPMRTHDTQFVIIIISERFCAFIAALWRCGKFEARRKLHRQIKARRKLALPPCTSIYCFNDFAKHRVLLQDPRKSRPVRSSFCNNVWQTQNSRLCMPYHPTWAFAWLIASNNAEMLLLIWILALFPTGAVQTAAVPCHFICFHQEDF
jgi:hypothetical protein